MSGKNQIVFSDDWKIIIVLIALTLAVFLPSVRFDFVGLDDGPYVYENPMVMGGLRPSAIRWAFTTVHEQYWLPVLWLSFMADVSFWGQGPFGHHLINALLHVANVSLLYWTLYRMTGARWRSAFAAALFALHPLRVEAVAWVTARKDVLSGLFWMLSMLAYLRYVEQPLKSRYALIAAFLFLGLASKAILIVLPVIFLLMDYWPLRRGTSVEAWRRLILEKGPLFVLSAIFVCVNLFTHESGRGAHVAAPWIQRIALAPTNYWAYLGKTFWPTRLAIIYPEHDAVHVPIAIIAIVGLLLITGVLWRWRNRYPYLLIGWLWFIVTLFPVIRGVRMGLASMTDRFTYLPSIGLSFALAWFFAERVRKALPWGIATIIILAGLAHRQLFHWRNSETVFRHALSVTDNNFIAAYNLAEFLERSGRSEESLAFYRKTVELGQGQVQAVGVTANSLLQLKRYDEAEKVFLKAIASSLKPGKTHSNLGMLYFQTGRFEEAINQFKKAAEMEPNWPDAHFNMALALHKLDRNEEALPAAKKVLELRPGDKAAQLLMSEIKRKLARQ